MRLPLVHRVRDHDLRASLIAWFSKRGLGIYRSQGPAAGVTLNASLMRTPTMRGRSPPIGPGAKFVKSITVTDFGSHTGTLPRWSSEACGACAVMNVLAEHFPHCLRRPSFRLSGPW